MSEKPVGVIIGASNANSGAHSRLDLGEALASDGRVIWLNYAKGGASTEELRQQAWAVKEHNPNYEYALVGITGDIFNKPAINHLQTLRKIISILGEDKKYLVQLYPEVLAGVINPMYMPKGAEWAEANVAAYNNNLREGGWPTMTLIPWPQYTTIDGVHADAASTLAMATQVLLEVFGRPRPPECSETGGLWSYKAPPDYCFEDTVDGGNSGFGPNIK
jgi:hypothetical protein